MPGLEELGWLQFERLCELVLEADAGVDPTRWEGSADRSREVVCEDALRLHGRTLAPPVLDPLPVVTRRSGRFAAFPFQVGRHVHEPPGAGKSSGGCSSSASVSWCWKLMPESTLRAGRAQPTAAARSSARTSSTSTAGRSRRRCSSAASGRARDTVDSPPSRYKSVVTFTNRPGPGRHGLRRGRAARRDPAPAGAAHEAAVDPLARRRAARPGCARALDLRHRGHARARARVRSHAGVEPRRRGPRRAQRARPHRPAGDGQDRDRAHARPRAAHAGLGGARDDPARAGRGALRPLAPAAVHRRRRVRLDRVPPGLRRALGQQPRPHPARHRRAPLARSGRRAPRRCAPACGACTASAAASTSRSPRPSRSTRPRSAWRRRR